jgi:predicted metal-dependent hydrolase
MTDAEIINWMDENVLSIKLPNGEEIRMEDVDAFRDLIPVLAEQIR